MPRASFRFSTSVPSVCSASRPQKSSTKSRQQTNLALQGDKLTAEKANPANLMLVEKLLERRHDIRLLVAKDGISGIEAARAARPDIILMDINLPGISGLTALGILTEDPDTMHMPVIALSANAMPGDIEKGLAAGFFRYLTKPIKVNEFMDTLDSALAFTALNPRRRGAIRGVR